MADLKGIGLSVSTVKIGKMSTVTLSGTVVSNNVGVVRDIIVYKKGEYFVPWCVTSESDGTWSLDVNAGTNDEFIVICLGNAGEWSGIYDHIIK